MQGKKQYQEKLFITFQLSKRVPENNFYRRLKGELDLSFLRNETKKYYGKEGQKSIDPIVFFKLMLIGYLGNINSDRKIIEMASMRMDMLYFIGYDLDEELPWHSTLSRTRKLYGEELFLEVFKKVLSLCISKGMVKGSRQALDSAHIKANASMDSLVEKTIMEEATTYLHELSENSEDKNDNEDEDHPIRKKKRGTKKSNSDFESTTDSDAKISKKKHKPLQLNYLGQISVDTVSHVICGAMADFADKRDSQSVETIVGQTIDNLSEQAIQLEEVLADTNYSSGQALKFLEEKNIQGYIPSIGGYISQRKGFTYFSEADYYLCEKGIKLPFKGVRERKDGIRKQYWSCKTDCKNCSIKIECTGKSGFKRLEDTIDKPYYDRMHKRVNTSLGKRMMRLRSSTVEPVLGTLINFRGMKRVNTRGISLAHKHVLLASTAYNLKKYIKHISKYRENITITLRENIINTIENTFCYVFNSIKSIFSCLNINKKSLILIYGEY